MKLSVSLSVDEVAMLDDVVARNGLSSRSAGVRRAIAEMQRSQLTDEFVECFSEPRFIEDVALWDDTLADGIDSAKG